MKVLGILCTVLYGLSLFAHSITLTKDQKDGIDSLANELVNTRIGSKQEAKVLRQIAFLLNERTPYEAFITDPNSNGYKQGLVTLVQALKLYAWKNIDDTRVTGNLQQIASHIKVMMGY